MTSESRFLPADQPDGQWKVILPRENGIEYDVRHRGDHFFIEIRDENRPNSEVLVAPVADPKNAQVSFKHHEPHWTQADDSSTCPRSVSETR